MDNGHKGAIFSSIPEMDNNLNTENWQESLKEAIPAGMPTPEQLTPNPETPETPEISEASKAPAEIQTNTLDTPTKPNLGQIVPINIPQVQSQDEARPYNPTNIKTTGDRLDKDSLAEIGKLEEKLNQDGDLNSFYDHTRDLTEVNLDNSFSRKLYQSGGEK